MSSNPELSEFIRQGLSGGKSAEELRASLASAGWASADINAAFAPESAQAPAPQAAKPKRKLLWLWITIGAVALLALGGGAFAVLKPDEFFSIVYPQGRDVASVNDADLELSAVTLPKGQSFVDAGSLKSLTVKSKVRPNVTIADIDRQISGEDPWDQAFVTDVLSESKEIVELQFAKITSLQIAGLSDPKEVYYLKTETDIGPLIASCKLALLGLISDFRKTGAWMKGGSALIAATGSEIANTQIDTQGYLAGLDLVKTGIASVQDSPLNFREALQLEEVVKMLDQQLPSPERAFKADYLLLQRKIAYFLARPDEASRLKSADLGRRSYRFEPNKTMNLAAAAYRRAIETAKRPCGAEKYAAPAALKAEGENAAGIEIVNGIEKRIAETLNARCAVAAVVGSERSAVAKAIGEDSPRETAKDDPSIDDSGLALGTVDAGLKDNGYLPPTVTDALVNEYRYDELRSMFGDFIEGRGEGDGRAVSSIRSKYGSAIASFVEAAHKTRVQYPEFADPRSIDSNDVRADVDYPYPVVKLATAVALDAFSRAKAGDGKGAAEEATAIVFYGQKLAASQIDLLGYKAGLEIRALGLKTLKKLAEDGALTPEDKKRAESVIAGLGDTGNDLARAMKIDYWANRDSVEMVSKKPDMLGPELEKKAADPFFLESTRTINRIADYERAGIRIASAACAPTDVPVFFADPVSQEDFYLQEILTRSDRENAVGKLILAQVQHDSNESWNYLRCEDAELVSAVKQQLGG